MQRDRHRQGSVEHPIDEMMARVVKVAPRLRMAHRYKQRLAGPLQICLEYVEELVAGLPAPLDASISIWASNSLIRTFFSSPGEMAAAFGRSAELRTFFDESPDAQEAYAVLGMDMEAHGRFGCAQDGEVARTDVLQTVVNFSDHQVRICARTLAGLRQDIVRRMVDQLAIEGLARITAEQGRREVLERERALLLTRWHLLERRGAGVRSILDSRMEIDRGKLVRLQQELEANERDLYRLGLRTQALDRQIECMVEVFRNPAAFLHVWGRSMRVSLMNVVLQRGSTEAGETVEFQMARVPGDPARERAFTLVRFSRADLPPAPNSLQEAARWLN
ncbi:hypothetical protein N7L95_26185 (plasmid) [Eleftheria terrae]|nr:hypothetical protein N7L95_26185 [Eleftheria terrae]